MWGPGGERAVPGISDSSTTWRSSRTSRSGVPWPSWLSAPMAMRAGSWVEESLQSSSSDEIMMTGGLVHAAGELQLQLVQGEHSSCTRHTELRWCLGGDCLHSFHRYEPIIIFNFSMNEI